jgi:Uma2 family endonuclease
MRSELMLAKENEISYDDFIKLREVSDNKLEFIDSTVYMAPAPTPIHQKICFKVSKEFDTYFAKNKCIMLQGVNVRFSDRDNRKIGDVIPDISVFCDYENLDKTFIEDIPAIIVEIVSPSTVFIDNIKKADLYKRAGVREYWIVDSKSKHITIWDFYNDEQMIFNDIAKSFTFTGLTVSLQELFI